MIGKTVSASVPGAKWNSDRHYFTGEILAAVKNGKGPTVYTVTCPEHFSHDVHGFAY